jgi:D-alanyl-D-alanine endopeptidase (penicillin-binding protein 7)
MGNLVAWSLQAGAIALAVGALSRVLPIEQPRPRLVFLQALLLLLLGLPILQPRQAVETAVTHRATRATWSGGAGEGTPRAQRGRLLDTWASWLAGLLVGGASLRLARTGLGLARLRSLRRGATPLEEAPWLARLRSEVAPRARFVTSPLVTTPATFGLRRPIVVLPPGFASMDRDGQEAVALHELLHVRRRDWAILLSEELVQALLFFHPAVHWLVGRIRLAREQAVDEAAVARLGAREPYVLSLLEVARHAVDTRAVPAAPFLRESHLRERVNLLLQEVAMSPARALAHVSLTAAALLLTTGLAVSAAPLRASRAGEGAPEEKPISTEAKLVHKVNPVYPPEAKADKAEGVIRIEVRVGKDGTIQDARVVSSAPSLKRMDELDAAVGGSANVQEADPRLAAAALDAVRQWRYDPVIKNGKAVDVLMTLTIRFRLE